MVKRLGAVINSILERPYRVAIVCVIGAFGVLVADGTLFRLWRLKRDHQTMVDRVKEIKNESASLQKQIQEARKLEFVEREARDRFDLADPDDLVFVFSNDEAGFEIQEAVATRND